MKNNYELPNSVDEYLQEIGSYPLLSKEKEQELGERILQGDEDAKEQLFLSNLRFAFSIAKKYMNKNFNYKLDIMDLVSEANIGLFYAVQRFDIRKGTSFAVYAASYIKKQLFSALSNQSREIFLNSHRYTYLKKFMTKKEELEKKYGRELSIKELADELHLSSFDIIRLFSLLEIRVSLNNKIRCDDEELEFVESFQDEDENVEEKILEKEMNECLNDIIMHDLTTIERDIIKRRYGFLGKVMTLKEIKSDLNLNTTRQNISLIEKKALNKIRNGLQKRKMKMR